MDRRDSDSNVTSSYEEYLPILARNYRPSVFGRVRTLSNIQTMEWYFVLFSVCMLAIGLFFTLIRIIAIDWGSDQFLVSILVVINLTFAAYYLVHGILQEQPFEILTYIFTTFIIAVFVTINFTSAETEDYVIRVIRFVITVFLTVPNIALAFKIGKKYWESGTYIFKTVGGDMGLQRTCRIYLFGQSLLIFDVQAMLSCVMIVMRHGFSGMTNEEIYMFATGIMFTFVWLFVGYLGMRTENVPITWIFAVISIVQPLYVLYLYVQGLDQIGPYSIRTNSAYFAAVVLSVGHFTLLAILPIIGSNYGKGLKESIYGVEPSTLSSNNSNPDLHDGGVINPPSLINYDEILPAD